MSLKIKNFEESEALLKSTKEEREVARAELKAFKKEKGIKGEDPTDEKILKTFTKLKGKKESKEASVEEIREWQKANKPKKERAERPSKYTYPAECVTPLDKKKFRAKARTAKKNEGKPAKVVKAEGKKADAKKEAPKGASKAERKALKKAAAKAEGKKVEKEEVVVAED